MDFPVFGTLNFDYQALPERKRETHVMVPSDGELFILSLVRRFQMKRRLAGPSASSKVRGMALSVCVPTRPSANGACLCTKGRLYLGDLITSTATLRELCICQKKLAISICDGFFNEQNTIRKLWKAMKKDDEGIAFWNPMC